MGNIQNKGNTRIAEEKFKNIAEAYQVLSDDGQRQKYDRSNLNTDHDGGSRHNGPDFQSGGGDPFATRHANNFNPTTESHFDRRHRQTKRRSHNGHPPTPFARPSVDLVSAHRQLKYQTNQVQTKPSEVFKHNIARTTLRISSIISLEEKTRSRHSPSSRKGIPSSFEPAYVG
jgi:DnaJ-class molecular chaperone